MLHSILDPTEIHIENCTIHIRSYRNKDREYTIHIRSHRNKERKFYNPYWILQKLRLQVKCYLMNKEEVILKTLPLNQKTLLEI